MKNLLVPALLIMTVVVAGCVAQNGNSSSNYNPFNATAENVVRTGDHVYVNYTGRFENGTIFDSSANRGPLDFYAGQKQLIKGFDDAVIGMRLGQEKTVTIQPQDGYGNHDPAKVIGVNRSIAPPGVVPGDVLYTATGQQVLVVNVTNQTLTIDMNPPLAGKVLIFDIKVLNITKS